VGDTYVSTTDWKAQHLRNRAMLSQLGQHQSTAKSTMEETLKERQPPVVRIDTTPKGPRAQRVQDWAHNLPQTPTPTTPHTTVDDTVRLGTPVKTAVPGGGDSGVVELLSKLVDTVDALTTSHQDVLHTSTQMRTQLESYADRMRKQQDEIDLLRAQRALGITKPKTTSTVYSLPDSVSVPNAPSTGPKSKLYDVAKGRQVGIFTTWKETERSVRGFLGAIHKRFLSKKAAALWRAITT
jgi:hypothetical protein